MAITPRSEEDRRRSAHRPRRRTGSERMWFAVLLEHHRKLLGYRIAQRIDSGYLQLLG